MDGHVNSALVSTAWLGDHLGEPDIVVLDATWTAKGIEPDAAALYAREHIPGARRFDVDRIADHASSLPHMLPTPELFAAEAGLLGIANGDLVVAYDATGITSAAARCWWMFRVFGHGRVAVLDGGLPKWMAENRSIATGTQPTVAPKSFIARFHGELVRDLESVRTISERGGATLLDARSAGRFEGTAPEPWARGRGGHIPGSRSLPFADLIDPESKMLLPPERLRARLTAHDGPIVTSCGSGVTACVLALAYHEIGRPNVAVYDGSWAEWGSHAELPVALGPA